MYRNTSKTFANAAKRNRIFQMRSWYPTMIQTSISCLVLFLLFYCSPLLQLRQRECWARYLHDVSSENWQQAKTEEEDIIATTLNRTRSDLVLVYNRVPKCSSTSMYMLIKALSLRNNFTFSLARSDDIRNELRSAEKERELVKDLRSLKKDAVYVRHMYNPDWARLGLEVNLVNMVRDPISRMASWFYFIR